MAEGTNVGNIFLDLIVRDTVEKQVQNMAAKGQQVAQKAFSGMEKVTESAVNNMATNAGKAAQKVSTAFGAAFNKPVELAKSKLRQLDQEFSDLSTKAEELMRKDTSFQFYGYVSDGNKEFAAVEKQLDKVYRRLEAARERLAIEMQAAAQKQAEAEEKAARRAAAAAEKAALKQQKAAEKAAASAVRAAERAAIRREREERRAAIAAEKAAKKAAAAEEKAANRRKGILAAMWKNMLSQAGDSTRNISGKITGLIKNFTTAGKATRRFGSRLREIVSGALIFNGISAALRKMVSYLGEGIAASDEMKQALANLKGAAANAASPLIQALTPALVTVANAAATALSYVERLLTRITGKVSNAAALAEKSASKTTAAVSKAAKTLAGFDELNRLDSGTDSGNDDSEEIEPNYGFKGSSPFLDSILAAIDAGKWGQIGTLIAEKLNSTLSTVPWDTILQKVKNWTQNFVDTLNGFIHRVDFGLIGTALGQGLNTLWTIIDTFFRGIDWLALGVGIANGLNDLIITIDWAMLGRVLSDKLKALFEVFHGFVATFDFAAFGSSLSQMLNAAFDNINWDQLWEDIKLCLTGLWEGVCAFFAELEPDTLSAVISVLLLNAIRAALSVLGPVIGKMLSDGLATSMHKVLADLKTWATGTLLPKATGWIKGTLVPKVMAAFSKIGAVVGLSAGWVAAIAAAVAVVVALIVKHGDEIKAALNKLSDWLSGIFCRDWTEIFGDVLGGIINDFVENVGDWLGSIKEMFFGLNDVLTGVFALNWKKFWGGLGSIAKGAINGVISVINGMISAATGAINILFRLLSFKINLPNGGKIGLSLPQVTAPKIPYLADGGVIKQPTLAMVGEYSGASSNPEIVAPQSLIAETVASVMNDMMAKNQMSLAEIASILRQILNAVVSVSAGGLRIFIGSREVFQVVVDENNRAVLRTGSSPLKG